MLTISSCIFDDLHSDIFFDQVFDRFRDLLSLAADDGDRSADGGILHDGDIGENDVERDVEHLRHGGDDRLVDVALNIGQADDELAGLETRDGGILGDERFDLLEVRGRVDEALRDVLLGLSEDREDLALLDDAAVFHDGDAVTDLLDDSHLVRDEHDRDAERFVEVLEKVGLGDQIHKKPNQMSGGQMQRVAIARALVNNPDILLADEPTSMIDACSRATILDMLLKLRDEINMTIIFITHDIGLAYYVSDNVYIMEHGKFVESGPAEEVILHPTAAYTKRLISDVPKIYEPWDLTTV